jgi:hypothetical protein
MYKAAVRWMIRRNIARANAGDYRPALAMFSDDLEFSFPGDNSWADEFRPLRRGRQVHVTHRGKAEMERFLQRYVAAGIQMEIEDILVNGPPWNLRAASGSTTGRQATTGTATTTGPSCSSPRDGESCAPKRTTRTPSGRPRWTPCSATTPRSPSRRAHPCRHATRWEAGSRANGPPPHTAVSRRRSPVSA